MKRLLFPLLALSLFACAPKVQAWQPLPEKPLAERVQMATHVFVGVVRKVSVIDGDGAEVKPEPKSTDTRTGVLYEVEVEEALTPADWKPPTLVKIPWGGGFFDVEGLKEAVGKRWIFITKVDFSQKICPIYYASYDVALTEKLEKKAEIVALVKPRPDEARKWARDESLAYFLQQIETLKVGSTRGELEKLFAQGNDKKYIFRDCRFLSVEVEFPRSKHAISSDKITKISKPTFEWPK